MKYMAAGADAIMLGSRLSKCPESIGWEQERNLLKKTLYKRYRGQASASFQKDKLGKVPKCPEGATGPKIYPGASVEEVIGEFEGGVKSALSYLGLDDLKDLGPRNALFIRITASAVAEGKPHGT